MEKERLSRSKKKNEMIDYHPRPLKYDIMVNKIGMFEDGKMEGHYGGI